MNYERVILNLLNDVDLLKEQVAEIQKKLDREVASSVDMLKEQPRCNKGSGTMTFMDYLRFEKGMQLRTAQSRLSNCNRVARYEGDIESHYQDDRCRSLLARLEYTSEDQDNRRPARHKIPIDGNVYNGTATLKQAVSLYVGYLDYLASFYAEA